MNLDHGILNVPLAKRDGGSLDAQIDKHLAAERREARRKRRELAQARQAAARAEVARRRFTAEELDGAIVVRDRHGWHKVVRISGKSVTVETPYSWTERIPLGNVLEFRSER